MSSSNRISLQQLYSVPDILSTDAFYFLLTNLPQTVSPTNPNTPNTNSQNWQQTLALKVQNVTYPGFSNEKMTVPVASHQINFRGRRVQPQSLTVSFYEDRTMQTMQVLRQWHEYIVGTLSGVSGGYRDDYSTTGTLQIFDTTGLMINQNSWYKLFLQDVPDITFDGSSTQAMIVSATFSYDYSDDSLQAATLMGGQTLSGDPGTSGLVSA